VDEAHHIASGFDSRDPAAESSYEELRRAARDADRILLLSATPLLHNERNFLAMLHLLDPALYPLDGLAEFTARVASRRDFALRFQAFVPGAPDYVLEEHALAFSKLFSNDDVLTEQLRTLEEAIDADDVSRQADVVTSTRVHLGETYRLHQRVLRTRRGSPLARDFPVRGRRPPQRLLTRWVRSEPLDEWLSAWLDSASTWSAALPDPMPILPAVLGFLDRWRGAPAVLHSYVDEWLEQAGGPTATAEITVAERAAFAAITLTANDREHLRHLRSILEKEDFRERWLSETVDHVLGTPENTVVFCTHTATATLIADELDRRLAPRSVGRYTHSRITVDNVERELAGFQRGVRPYLVCDRAGEEGRNLQFARASVHVDLPWSPNRIEQRIGRLDRYAESDPVPSLVLVSESGVDAAWLALLVDGYGLFDDSIATLQHVLDKTVLDAVRRLIDHGPTELAQMAPALRERLETERREILQLEHLESIEGEHIFGRGLFGSLQDAEMAESELESATEAWLCGTRAFPESIGVECRLDADRSSVHYYHIDRFAELGMPYESVISHMGPCLGRARKYTFRRDTSYQNTDVALARPGEAILDALEDLTRVEDLGQTFAFWRRYPRAEDPLLLTTFTFRVEADADRGTSLLAGARVGPDRREALERTVDSFFAPQTITVWLGSDGMPVTDETLLKKLQPSFNWRSDRPLSSALIPRLENMFQLDWASWWRHQAGVAQREAETRAELVERKGQSARQAVDAYAYARHQLSLRSQIEIDPVHRTRFDEEIEVHRRLEAAVIAAIDAAVAMPEAVGVVLLARETPHDLLGIVDE
jgi:ATP-dependent helicase HepA